MLVKGRLMFWSPKASMAVIKLISRVIWVLNGLASFRCGHTCRYVYHRTEQEAYDFSVFISFTRPMMEIILTMSEEIIRIKFR